MRYSDVIVRPPEGIHAQRRTEIMQHRTPACDGPGNPWSIASSAPDMPEATLSSVSPGLTEAEQRGALEAFPGGKRFRLVSETQPRLLRYSQSLRFCAIGVNAVVEVRAGVGLEEIPGCVAQSLRKLSDVRVAAEVEADRVEDRLVRRRLDRVAQGDAPGRASCRSASCS